MSELHEEIEFEGHKYFRSHNHPESEARRLGYRRDVDVHVVSDMPAQSWHSDPHADWLEEKARVIAGATAPQPAPKPNNNVHVVDVVVADLADRKEMGILKYGVPLQPANGRRPLVDLYQELLDAVLYLRQHLLEEEMRDAR